jgi:hypothetical protein
MQTTTFTRDELVPAFAPEQAVVIAARLPVGVNLAKGTVLGCVATVQRNDVKTITVTGTPTGGTWTFSMLGLTSAAIAHNATAAQVQVAVDAFFGAGNCVVTGGPGPGTPWVLTFGGVMGNVLVTGITVAGAFTGGTAPAVAVANTTPGSSGAGQMAIYNGGASDGTETARGVLKAPYRSDVNGANIGESSSSGQPANAQVYIKGYFRVADLVGLDANAVPELGRMAVGTAFNTAGGVIAIY